MDLRNLTSPPSERERVAIDRVLADHGFAETEETPGRTAIGGRSAATRRDLLLPALHALNDAVGWISEGGLGYACERLTVPPADGYGVAAFYDQFTFEERVEVVRVCDDIVCGPYADQLLAGLDGMAERTVTLSSLGKTFSLTGWKIGWAIAPPALTAGVRAAHQFLTYATSTPLQHGAAAALRAPKSYYEAFVTDYRRKRDLLVAGLDDLGFGVRAPAGTYFVLADHTPFGFSDDVAFCRHLTVEAGVAAVPMSAFYESAGIDHFARFAFCKRPDTIDEAIRRLKAHFGA